MTLIEKLIQVYEKIDHIQKAGHNKSQNYDFVRAADMVRAVRKALLKLGVYAEVNLFSERQYTIAREKAPSAPFAAVDVRCVMIFHDVESGETITASGLGTGADTGDKAVYKAMTGSRKYAIINIFNLPIGNDVEEHGAATGEELKGKQKSIAANKIAAAAAAGNKTAIDAMSQAPNDDKLIITRPEEYNGHYFIASGLIAVPALDRFFNDTGCKRIDSRKTGKVGWKVPAEYEKGLLAMCDKLKIEVD